MQKKQRTCRTLETKKRIKETFLSILDKKPFREIRVTKLCEKAGVTRATFYSHYVDIYELADEVISDALVLSETEADITCAETLDVLAEIVRKNDVEYLKENARRLPPCHKMARMPKYSAIVKDETLSLRMLKEIHRTQKDRIVPRLCEEASLSKEEAESVFWMIINGTFAVNRAIGCEKEDEWYRMQLLELRFILGGLKALKASDTKN